MHITQVAQPGDSGLVGPSRRMPRFSLRTWRYTIVRPKPQVLLAAAVLVLLLTCAIVPGALAPYAATDMDSDAILSPPGLHHWFGTDHFGRDILSLIIYGAGQSLTMGGQRS